METVDSALSRMKANRSPEGGEGDPAGSRRTAIGDPNCPHCHGIGYVREEVEVDHPNFGKLFPCSCRYAEIEAAQKQHQREISSLSDLAGKAFDTFNPEGRSTHKRHRDSLSTAFAMARRFAVEPQGWLLLHGNYGCGKTHLAAAIGNELLGQGKPVLFVNAPDLLDHLRATFGPGSDVSYDELFERVREAPVLIMDDLGAESPTPWAQEKLYQILNHRYMGGDIAVALPTVITTNTPLDRIEPRVRSRILDGGLVRKLVIDAPDYRGIDYAGVRLSSLDSYNHLTFDNFDSRKKEVIKKDEWASLGEAVTAAKAFAADPRGWLVLMGPHGCGKTHLAAAVANQRDRLGDTVIFLTFVDLLDHLRSTFSPESTLRYDKVFNEIKNTPLLILDDLMNLDSATSWAREKTYQLIDYRKVNRLPTVITTVLKPDEIDERLEVRMFDPELTVRCGIAAPMYRGKAPANKAKR